MGKKRNTGLILAILSITAVLGLLAWFLITIFESENPQVQLGPIPEYLSEKQDIPLVMTDMKRGLRKVRVSLRQEGRDITILDKAFPFQGLFNQEGTHRFETVFPLDPSGLNQGRADLQVQVWDYSRRSGGDGNLTISEHKITVDTIPPAIRAVSRLHYVNRGGAVLSYIRPLRTQ